MSPIRTIFCDGGIGQDIAAQVPAAKHGIRAGIPLFKGIPMKRLLLLAAVLAATLATAQIPFSIPDVVPSAIPEPIPGGGGVGFKWLTEPSDQSVNEAAELAFSIEAKRGGIPIVYTIGANDSGAVDASTGAYTWTPSYAGAGTYTVTFTATAGGRTLSKAITITVNNVFSIAWVHEPHDTSGVEYYALTHTFDATPLSGSIAYSATGLPYNATYNASTGAFAWTPVGLQADTSWTPTFTATVNGDTIETQINLTCGIVANITANLAIWHKLDILTNPTPDSSGNARNGVIVGGPVNTTDRFGRANRAMLCDGDDGDTLTYRITSPFTITMWLYRTGDNVSGTIPFNNESGAPPIGGLQIEVNQTTNVVSLRVRNSSNATQSLDGGVAADSTWAFVAVSYDGDSLHVYVDDAENAADATITAIGSVNNPTRTARQANNNYGWKGKVDDVRVYTALLTDAQIAQIKRWRDR